MSGNYFSSTFRDNVIITPVTGNITPRGPKGLRPQLKAPIVRSTFCVRLKLTTALTTYDFKLLNTSEQPHIFPVSASAGISIDDNNIRRKKIYQYLPNPHQQQYKDADEFAYPTTNRQKHRDKLSHIEEQKRKY